MGLLLGPTAGGDLEVSVLRCDFWSSRIRCSDKMGATAAGNHVDSDQQPGPIFESYIIKLQRQVDFLSGQIAQSSEIRGMQDVVDD